MTVAIASLLLVASVSGAGCASSSVGRSVQDRRVELVPPSLSGVGSFYTYNPWSFDLSEFVPGLDANQDVRARNVLYFGFGDLENPIVRCRANGVAQCSVFETRGGVTETIFNGSRRLGFMPFATDGSRLVGAMARYDALGNEEERYLVVSSSGGVEWHKLNGTDGLVSGAAILGDFVYYTVLDRQRGYSLWRVSLAEAQLGVPELVPVDIAYPDVYAHNGELLFRISETVVAGDTETWTCGDICVFPTRFNLAVSLTAGNAGLVVTVWDGASGDEIACIDWVYGMWIDERGLVVQTTTGIQIVSGNR